MDEKYDEELEHIHNLTAKRVITTDFDSAMDAMREADARIPDAVRHQADAEAAAFANAMASPSGTPFAQVDAAPEHGISSPGLPQDTLSPSSLSAPPEVTPSAPTQAPEVAPGPAPAVEQGGTSSPSTDTRLNAEPAPTSFEQSLSNIQVSDKAQSLLQVQGDPRVERVFYELLAARGELYYQGGSPMITVSHDKAVKVLELAAEKCGVKLEHALQLKADLDKRSLADTLLSRKHQLNVYVAGSPEVIEAKRNEIHTYMQGLTKNGYLKGDDLSALARPFVASRDESTAAPLRVQGADSLVMLLDAAKEKQRSFREQERGKDKLVKDGRYAREDASLRDEAARSSQEPKPATSVGPSPYVQGFIRDLSEATKPGAGTGMDQKLLNRAKPLKDEEIAALPASDRQKALMDLAVVAARHGDDKHVAVEKLRTWLDAERRSDPYFVRKAEQTIGDDLAKKGAVDPKQADGALSLIRDARGAKVQEVPSTPEEALAQIQNDELRQAKAAPAEKASNAPSPATEVKIEPPRRESPDVATQKLMRQVAEGMSTPQKTLLNRDKTWNTRGVQNMAEAMVSLSPSEMRKADPESRARMSAYAGWLAAQVEQNRIPGLSPDQRQRLSEQAHALRSVANGVLPPPETSAMLVKADRMTDRMVERESSHGLVNQRSPATREAESLANGLVSAVYQRGEITEAKVHHLLKNAGRLDPDSLKNMDPDQQARTAVALKTISSLVKEGGIGDFSSLSPLVKKQCFEAERMADGLSRHVEQTHGPLPATRAYLELQAAERGPASDKAPGELPGSKSPMAEQDASHLLGRSGRDDPSQTPTGGANVPPELLGRSGARNAQPERSMER